MLRPRTLLSLAPTLMDVSVRLRLRRQSFRKRSRSRGRFFQPSNPRQSGSKRSASGDHAERALYARAVSRAKSGDEAGARADFEAYLKQYPNRFASKARESLRGVP